MYLMNLKNKFMKYIYINIEVVNKALESIYPIDYFLSFYIYNLSICE